MLKYLYNWTKRQHMLQLHLGLLILFVKDNWVDGFFLFLYNGLGKDSGVSVIQKACTNTQLEMQKG